MKLSLNTDCYSLLLDHIGLDAPARSTLEKATKLSGGINTGDEYWIDCTPQEADEFLDTARKYFPTRVRQIEQAIVNAAH